MALDGIVLLLAKVEFAGKTLGHITEEGLEWGGSDPEYVTVTSAQTRTVVKRLLKKAGTDEMTFRMFELLPENCVSVMGGTATLDKYSAPVTPVVLEGVAKITTVTGQVIDIPKATLMGAHRGSIGGDDPLAVQCTLIVENDGLVSPYSIDNSDPA